MKIEELLAEATMSHVLRKVGRSIKLSNVWEKTWTKAALGWDGVEDELKQFYQDKCWFDPPLSFGKKDYPMGGNLEKLRGFQHAHMHFGKLVVVYRVEGDHVLMYVAGDHKIVEAGGLTALSKLVPNLTKDAWTTIPAPARTVVPQNAVPDHITQAIQDLYELMLSDPDANRVLRAFAQDDKKYWQIIPYQQLNPELLDVTALTMHELAVAFLQQS